MGIKKFITCYCLLLLSDTVMGSTLQIYPKPEGIEPSVRFKVEAKTTGKVIWNDIFVYQSNSSKNGNQDASWAPFSFTGEVEIRITPVNIKTDSVIVRPRLLGIKWKLVNNQIIIKLSKPVKFSVELDGNTLNPLFIFADHVSKKPDPSMYKKLVSFKPGVHEIGDRYPLQSNTTYYLEGGAVLKGSFYGSGKIENVTICGRGIINSGYQHWKHPMEGLLCNIALEDAINIRIEGITCIESGNFQMKIQSKQPGSQISVENVKLIGWNGNTDGIHVSDMDWKDHPQIGNAKGIRLIVNDCFIRCNDDAVLLCDGVSYSEVNNCTIWDDGYGATFSLSWGGHQPVDSCRVKNCFVIHKEGNNPVFRANHAGEATIRDVRFENIFIEGNANTLINLRIMNHRYDPDPGNGKISHILFKNVTLEGISLKSNIEGLNENCMIEDITFQNLIINGKVINTPAELNLKTNAYVRGIKFVSL